MEKILFQQEFTLIDSQILLPTLSLAFGFPTSKCLHRLWAGLR